MQWIKNNVIGLLGLTLIVGSSLVTLYVKAEVNSGAVVQLKETVNILSTAQTAQNAALQGYAIKAAQLEGQINRFAISNNRLVVALDKLDALYGASKVTDAIQDERIKQIVDKIDK
jgi:hypothetical protein